MSDTKRALVVCDQWLGGNGYAGMKALRRAGWSVRVVPEWEFVPLHWRGTSMRVIARALRPLAVRQFNAELVRQAKRHQPEMLLVFKGMFVEASTIDALRASGVRCYCFYPDVSFYVHGKYLPCALPRYDWVFVTKSFGVRDMRERLGIANASVLMHAYDPDLHRPLDLSAGDRERYECDVSFIGTWSPKKEEALNALLAARPGLSVRVWGEQWDRAALNDAMRRAVRGQEATGDEYVRAIRGSRINLGLLSERRAGSSAGDQITSRTFHIPASGGFMLHERTEELLALFADGKEVATFGDTAEMIAQIDRFLADDAARLTIAAAGTALVRGRDSWDARIQAILAKHAESRA